MPETVACASPARCRRWVVFVQASQQEGGLAAAHGQLEGNPDGTAMVHSIKRSLSAAGTAGSEVQHAGEAQQQPQAQRSTGLHWGATECDLDRLGWVRNLVQFGEHKQQRQTALAAPEAVSKATSSSVEAPPGPPELDTIGWLESGAGLRPQAASGAASMPGQAASSPASRGSGLRSREEVGLLQSWLQDTMAQVIAQSGQPQHVTSPGEQAAALGSAGSAGTDPATATAQLADAALWLYGMAFGELQRQVGTECPDRGGLLGGMWQHVLSLVELRWVGGEGWRGGRLFCQLCTWGPHVLSA